MDSLNAAIIPEHVLPLGQHVPRGFKQTDVGIIPNDWIVLAASEGCLEIQDGTHFSPRIRGHDFLYVTSKNIRFGHLDLSTADWIDEPQHRAIYRRCDVKKGDLLLTKDGANTGNAALNDLTQEFSLLSSVAFLRFNPNTYSSAYFLQQILTAQGQRQIQDAMAGNAITRLTLEKIKKLRFPVPPTKREQDDIATALSDADALIESLKRLVAKKRQIKQGAMQELLTGKVQAGKSDETPAKLDTPGKRALWNLGQNEELALRIDAAIREMRPDGWRGVPPREQTIKRALYDILQHENDVERIFLIVKAQREY